jgi:hypothetical protein
VGAAGGIEDLGTRAEGKMVGIVEYEINATGFDLLRCETFDSGLSCNRHERWEHRRPV